jgi:aspartyl aminopeptidase
LFPIAGLVEAELRQQDKLTEDNTTNPTEKEAASEEFAPLKAVTQRHHSHLINVVATDAGAQAEDIMDLELVLYDTQKACLGGLRDEFIFSARLDNLNQTYCATMGLIDSVTNPTALDKETSIRLIACFDHEEIGSMTAQGAFSLMLPAILRRLSVLPIAPSSSSSSSTPPNDSSSSSFDDVSFDKAIPYADSSTAYEQSLSRSFLLSADMAHSIHPNYAGKYELDHKPQMNKGPVIKINANARYATNSPGIVLMQEIARRAVPIADDDEEEDAAAVGVPLQLFVVRNDSSCGSTIGPMLSAHLGARTLDLGNPQLSMHSIRETAGAEDVHHAVRLFSSFFQLYSSLEGSILVDY